MTFKKRSAYSVDRRITREHYPYPVFDDLTIFTSRSQRIFTQ
ncbi:MAG: hypothetical protein Q4A75_04750 [Peptostreptococcaceae bacterium]|nr:hypothetical protein [Peptostreptococcaceae bacterium]